MSTATPEARLLVVEDGPNIRELLATSLRFAGFEVLTAATGGEAVKVATDSSPDLVVLDAGEKMASILTFTKERQLLLATEFEVFQTRLFEQERQSDLQPSQTFIVDLTGDGADDLVIVVHDRVIVYPQMTEPSDE